MEKKFYIYQYIDPLTMLPFYIGKGCDNRYLFHLTETSGNTENKKKYAYIEGLRNKGITPIIEKVAEDLDEIQAYELEEKLIVQYGRRDIDTNGILTNICISARPPIRYGKDHHNYGKKIYVPDEDKRRANISKARRGKPSGQLGLKKSASMKEKLSKSKTGTKLAESTKQKLRELNTGSNNPNYGTFWITNGMENKKVKSLDNLPDGWYKGRSVSHITGFRGAKNVRS